MYTNIELLTKELKMAGFSQYKISKMKTKGDLIKLSRGHYLINSPRDLKSIGERYFELGEEELGYDALSTYFTYYPTDGCLAYKLFNLAYKYDDLESILGYYYTIYDDNSIKSEDKKLMLYILSKTIYLPKGFVKMAKGMRIDDVAINNSVDDNIRKLILNNKFKKAINAIEHKRLVSDKDLLIKKMLEVSLLKKEEDKKYWLDLVNNKQYDTIHEVLSNNLEKGYINKFMQSVLKVVDDIIDLKETKEVPTASAVNKNDLFGLIESKNYEEALEACKNKYSRSYNINENLIYLLLLDINCRIRKIKQQENISNVIREKLKNPYNVYSNNKNLEIKSKTLLRLFMNGINARGLTIISARSNSLLGGIIKLVTNESDLICFPIIRNETPALVIQRVLPKNDLKSLKINDIIKDVNILTTEGIRELEKHHYKTALKKLRRVLLYGKAEPIVYNSIGRCISKSYGQNSMYLISEQVDKMTMKVDTNSKHEKLLSNKTSCSNIDVETPKVMIKTVHEGKI